MNFEAFSDLFLTIFRENGMDYLCNEQTICQFYHFTELLTIENQTTNLTSIRDVPAIIAKHYADCLFAERFLQKKATILDVGCGGGFPAVPLAICRPDLQITCIDSTSKKISFVKKAIQKLHLQNVKAIAGRIEDKQFASFREHFAVVTARAVANLQILAEITLPFVRSGGFMLAMKGSKGAEELADARNAIKLLGGENVEDTVVLLQCPEAGQCDAATKAFSFVSETRHLIQIHKTRQTPLIYPRSYANILKKPL